MALLVHTLSSGNRVKVEALVPMIRPDPPCAVPVSTGMLKNIEHIVELYPVYCIHNEVLAVAYPPRGVPIPPPTHISSVELVFLSPSNRQFPRPQHLCLVQQVSLALVERYWDDRVYAAPDGAPSECQKSGGGIGNQ